MNYPTIKIIPTETPKFNFLQRRNYLGEFSSEFDKARVRANLGIPDEYSLNWGNIKGTVESQKDLMVLINKLDKRIQILESLVNPSPVAVNIYYGTTENIPVDFTSEQCIPISVNNGQIEFFANEKCAWIALPTGWTLNTWKETTLNTSPLQSGDVKSIQRGDYILYYIIGTVDINNNFLIKFNK